LIRDGLYESYTSVLVRLPYQQGHLISLFHEFGQVGRVEHRRKDVLLQGRIPGRLVAQFQAWQVKPEDKNKEENDVPMDE
jgi:GTP-binding protein HflX